ncbi:hypothetical protein L1049_025140 [Liquidambar formosana]|uniref:SWIM-type domain-containing protein n=1 Tax=Liquidambar formosana TaxID=63359 RepID=A0AAP0X5C2_LIQFO
MGSPLQSRLVPVEEEDFLSCRKWDFTSLPCQHAISAIFFKKEAVEDYVSHWYTVETNKRSLKHIIYPVASEKYWDDSGYGPVAPPPHRRHLGRPKKLRRRDPEEVRRKGSIIGQLRMDTYATGGTQQNRISYGLLKMKTKKRRILPNSKSNMMSKTKRLMFMNEERRLGKSFYVKMCMLSSSTTKNSRITQRFMASIISYNSLPRMGSRSNISFYEIFIIWCVLNGHKLDLAHIILNILNNCAIKKESKGSHPYGMALTTIFNFTNVSLDNDIDFYKPKEKDSYSIATLHMIGFVKNENDKWIRPRPVYALLDHAAEKVNEEDPRYVPGPYPY